MSAAHRSTDRSNGERRLESGGFSIVEAVMAIGIMAAALVALAQLLAIATMNNRLARNATMAALGAQQKMEQLRAVSWDALSPSAGDSLDQNRSGWVDYLDARGAVLGAGSSPPPGTVFIRRWSIAPLAADPEHGVVLQVLVIPSLVRRAGAVSARLPGEARLVSVRTKRPGGG